MTPKRLPPFWVLGLTNAPLGISGALTLLVTPQLLAAQHVPEPRIAQITGLALVPGFCAFLLSPILDVRLSRRTYAFILVIVGAVFSFLGLLAIHRLELLGWMCFVSFFAIQLSVSAAGGWLAPLVPKEDESKLGAWFVTWNIGGFGITSIIGVGLLRALPYSLAAAILGLLVLAPLAVFPFIPAPGPDRRLARESFGQFARDLAALVRRREVLLSLIIFGVPAASFALTNTLGGLGGDYHASEQFVALVGGTGVTVAGVFGSLIVVPIAKKAPPLPLYIGVGVIGGLFTLALIVLPHTPAIYTVAMMGENIFQSAAFATANFAMFRLIGKDNPFSATQYALMLAAQSLPLSYMQVLDGRAYGWSGVRGSYLTDGGLGLAASGLLVLILILIRRRAATGQTAAPEAELA